MAEQLKKNSPERYPLQLLVWILGQLAGIGKNPSVLDGNKNIYLGLIMWKCNRMGLLPTHESDWLAFKEPLIRKDFIQGGPVM